MSVDCNTKHHTPPPVTDVSLDTINYVQSAKLNVAVGESDMRSVSFSYALLKQSYEVADKISAATERGMGGSICDSRYL